MSKDKIFIGHTKESFEALPNERVFLTKHSWDCGWYWGFGYIGNRNLHTHFDSVFLGSITDVDKIFRVPIFKQDDWWVLRDLFKQAYAIKECAEVYHHGGHQTTSKDTIIIQNNKMVNRLNKDLEIVLNKIWDIVNKTKKGVDLNETNIRTNK